MGGTLAKRRNSHSPPLQPSPEQAAFLTAVDGVLELPPIPGPKPWTDDVERAAVWHVCHASTPVQALCASGASPSSAKSWLSEEPPPTYQRACAALSDRLKAAEHVCSTTLLGRIYQASSDPKHWTAAAWIMERSRGYVVQQNPNAGPSTVVNIGQVVVNGTLATPERAAIIEAVPIQAEQTPSLAESLAVEGKR